MLLGGLTAADTSRPDIRIATPKGDRGAGQLPTGLHDTAAVRLGNAVYVFGGGTAANTQSDAIVRVPAAGGAGTQVAAAAGAELRSVRGCNRRHRLRRRRLHRESLARHDRRLATRLAGAGGCAPAVPAALRGGGDRGRPARDRGRLARERHCQRRGPRIHAADRPRLTDRSATGADDARGRRDDRRRDLRDRRPRRCTRHPHRPDRRGRPGGQGRVSSAGSLSSPRSDLAAVTLGDRILLAGGRDRDRHRGDTLSELTPATTLPARARRRRPTLTTPKGNVYAYDGANMLTGRRPLRAAAHLRPEQPERHGRRDRPAHLPRSSSTSPSADCRSTSCRPGT